MSPGVFPNRREGSRSASQTWSPPSSTSHSSCRSLIIKSTSTMITTKMIINDYKWSNLHDHHHQYDHIDHASLYAHLFVERPQEQCNLGFPLSNRPTPVCNRGIVEIQTTVVNIVVVVVIVDIVVNVVIVVIVVNVVNVVVMILTCFFSSSLLFALSPLGLKRSRMVSPEGDDDDCDGDGVGEDDGHHNIWSPGWGLCRSRFGETSSAQCTAQNLIQSSSWEGWPMTMMIHGMTIWWNLDI